jgi:NADH-quinone oxidoreductase subunit L
VHHAEPFNPQTGEKEDTDVGFPGSEHHIAEREFGMKAAMSVLAFGAIFLGAIELPGLTDVLHNFMEPTFEGDPTYNAPTDEPLEIFGLSLSGAIAIVGIATAYLLWVKRRDIPAMLRERLKPVYTLFVNKWYFDEAIEALFVRPGAWVGRFAQQTFERIFVDGVLVGGTTGIVRAGSAAVRAAQSGFLRAYAALLFLGLAVVAAYFLIAS